MRAAMIGLGKLGLPCAEVMACHHDVIGFDLNPPENPGLPLAASLEDAIRARELIFIAVQTPHDPLYGGEKPTSHLPPKDFDYSHVIKVLDDINALVTQDQLVVLISTTLPGTVREQLAPRLHRARFLYNPYLIAMGTVKQDMMNPEMIIVGTETGDADDSETMADLLTLKGFYKPIMQNKPRYAVGTWDEAEAIKIFYNVFISTKLTLVNMIQDVAEANSHMNVDVVTDALAKSTQRITGPAYMKAGLGDAGSCHPRDLIALRSLAKRLGIGYDLFGAIMDSREAQAWNLAQAALKHSKNVVILGKAYKPGVSYTAGSCSLLIGHYIEQAGGIVYYYDPNTCDYDHPDDRELVYLVAYWDTWVEDFEPRRGSTVIDPWRKCPASPYFNVIHYGNPRANTYV